MTELMEDIYKGDDDYRYILGRSPLIIFGVNPSTAKPGKPDPTIRFIESNFDSWIMLNICSQRASSPEKLALNLDEKKHKENIKCIKKIIEKYCDEDVRIARIVAGWGDSIEKRRYLRSCLQEIVSEIKKLKGKQVQWYRIGDLTKKGNPKHPAYYLKQGKKNIKDLLIPFDIDAYINGKA